MADAQDLKSWDHKKSCRFESDHRHHQTNHQLNQHVQRYLCFGNGIRITSRYNVSLRVVGVIRASSCSLPALARAQYGAAPRCGKSSSKVRWFGAAGSLPDSTRMHQGCMACGGIFDGGLQIRRRCHVCAWVGVTDESLGLAAERYVTG